MGLVSLLVYYKQAELLRITVINDQWWEPMRMMHSMMMALGRACRPQFSKYFLSTFKRKYYTAAHAVLQLMEIGLRRRRKRACWNQKTKHSDEQKIAGPGRELNPGPPPDDSSPKKESYY